MKYLIQLRFIAMFFIVGISINSFGQYPAGSPVALNGKLKLVGKQLSSECGNPVQLRGMTTHGPQWFGSCYKTSALDEMVNNWGIDIYRIAMYVQEGGYINDPAKWKTYIDTWVDECGKRGIYCMIDWHVLNPGDPNANLTESKDFWTYMATKHGSKRHVIYEICNEPNGVNWSTVKTYANAVIPVIRAIDPNTIIIVGTPNWSQDVDIAASDPLAFSNIMYTLHFYSGSHTQSLRDKGNAALAKGYALFVTECGTSGASGDGGPYLSEFDNWISWMNTNKISWINWSFSDKSETSAALNSGSCNASNWTNLTQSGTYIKQKINTADNFIDCGTTSSSITTAMTSPAAGSSNSEGSNITLSATAATTKGTISKVEFYYGTTLIGTSTSTSSPYSFTWNNVPAGSYSVFAKVTNSSGETANSSPVVVNVMKSIPQAATAPTIDGVVDANWANVNGASLNNLIAGTVSSTADLSATWKAQWDNTNLYLLAQITDNTKVNDGTDTYNDDALELFIDIGNDKATTYGTNDFQYVFKYNDTKVYENNSKSTTGITFSQTSSATGYIIEAKIPWSTLGGTPAINQLVGFDVQLNDDDDGGTRDGKIAWNATSDNAWQNPSLFGTVILKGTSCTLPSAAGTIIGKSSVCTGASETYSIATVTGATTYTWSVPTGSIITSGQGSASIVVTMGSTAGSISVTPSSSCGNGAAASLPITATTTVAASVSIAGNNAICSGASVNFTATPTNGGTPTYQWNKNGNPINNATGLTYTASNLLNGDKITVVMTSDLVCVSSSPATSNQITMAVTNSQTPSVSITGNNSICSGSSTTFTAAPTNGGTPTYQWLKNDATISTATAATYSASDLVNGDKISVVMTPSLACVTSATATSNAVTMIVTTSVKPSVKATGNNTICSGDQASFTAAPTNGGTAPTYQWRKNGTAINNATSSTYSANNLINGDKITVVMTSNLGCVTTTTATSAAITMIVTNKLTPSVSISGNNSICSGSAATFTASALNGGTAPSYQWQKNGAPINNATSSTYSATDLGNGDNITVVLTPDLSCAASPTATSSAITMVVTNSQAPSVTITGNSPICSGSSMTLTAVPTNGGTPTYQWNKNGAIINNATAATYTASNFANNDKITVTMTSSLACATTSTATSSILTLKVDQKPSKANAGADQNITTATTSMSAVAPTVGKGAWSTVSGSGSATNTALATSAVSGLANGANTFRWTISNGVCGPSIDDVIINVGSKPLGQGIVGPDKVSSGETVTYSISNTSGNTYQWSVPAGITIISGQGTTTLVVQIGNISSGSISVTETNQFGSTVSSLDLSFITSLFGRSASEMLNVYPNPFQESVSISINNIGSSTSIVKVYDIHGVEVYVSKEINSAEQIQIGKDFPMGVYTIQVISEGKINVAKIVKVQ